MYLNRRHIDRIKQLFDQFPIITLAASNDMHHYWKRFGFIETDIECNYGKHMINAKD